MDLWLLLNYALQYLFQYAYSHICGSMASFFILLRAMIEINHCKQ